MQVNRREVLAIGALGGLGVAGLSLPFGASVQAKAASALAAKNMPVPYTTEFCRPPVLSPDRVERDGAGRPPSPTTPHRQGRQRRDPPRG